MQQEAPARVYAKFKLHFYKEIFQRFQSREANLTTIETFSIESIQALHNPTISEFAAFMQISLPNAAYKVNSLVKKGYLKKTQSTTDHREYHLEITPKYYEYYNISSGYLSEVLQRIQNRFSDEELEEFNRMMGIIGGELMPEVELPRDQKSN